MKAIRQVSPAEFKIEWSDGKEKIYHLSRLQEKCPCAICCEGKRVVDPRVGATKIVGVGRYAIRIFFTSGCSNGIYDYDFLYSEHSL